MEKNQKLFEIADSQQGFFTTQQAVSAGFKEVNFHRRIKSNQWVRLQRGIYRLKQYPITDRPELVEWTLWSNNREGKPQGVWSHETALDIYELSDIMPSKMHMSVPKGFRRRNHSSLLALHYENLSSDEIEVKNGFQVTTSLRTLIDIIRESKIQEDFIHQSVIEAFHKGLISKSKLLQSRNKYPEITKILEILKNANL